MGRAWARLIVKTPFHREVGRRPTPRPSGVEKARPISCTLRPGEPMAKSRWRAIEGQRGRNAQD